MTKHPQKLEKLDGYAACRVVGVMSLEDAVAAITSAITSAREQNIRNLLVDITGVTGFEPPGLGSRYLFVTEWANAAQGRVRLALLADRRMIDPAKYGTTVAHSLGFAGDVFANEQAAVDWLLAGE